MWLQTVKYKAAALDQRKLAGLPRMLQTMVEADLLLLDAAVLDE